VLKIEIRLVKHDLALVIVAALILSVGDTTPCNNVDAISVDDHFRLGSAWRGIWIVVRLAWESSTIFVDRIQRCRLASSIQPSKIWMMG
jgi:hypothetical protein